MTRRERIEKRLEQYNSLTIPDYPDFASELRALWAVVDALTSHGHPDHADMLAVEIALDAYRSQQEGE